MSFTLKVSHKKDGEQKSHYLTTMRETITFSELKALLEAEIDDRDVFFEDSNDRYFYEIFPEGKKINCFR